MELKERVIYMEKNDSKYNYVIINNKSSNIFGRTFLINKCYEYVELEKRTINDIFKDKELFIDRGISVVKEDMKDDWGKFVNISLVGRNEKIFYNGIVIEASLQCMELLSKGLSLEEVYKLIDVHNSDCFYYGIKLSDWQNLDVVNIVSKYHERGLDFSYYRNSYINNFNKKKIKFRSKD